ncbi:hypothetical protein PI124_g6003 [Phytophthora idaei]|nr:hypothetical protein PI125_g6819 [Phytophthora idaei]KAG3161416.1 hypothetical protein PI126_g6452 [Phytophthora idaei]KAG3249350.1 hypothetical protein PI124_g6003 [Phytophthora idaei]
MPLGGTGGIQMVFKFNTIGRILPHVHRVTGTNVVHTHSLQHRVTTAFDQSFRRFGGITFHDLQLNYSDPLVAETMAAKTTFSDDGTALASYNVQISFLRSIDSFPRPARFDLPTFLIGKCYQT